MTNDINYQDWHIPFRRDQITLADAKLSLSQVGAEGDDIPLIVQLIENPKFVIPGLDLFHGAVELHHHDLIHLILGRGLLAMDEAFTIGFTMGSTKKVTTTEEKLYAWISSNFYPENYKFDEQAIRVFKDAVRLGAISNVQSLDNVNFETYMDKSLKNVRQLIGLESQLILTYYEIEQQRYPDSIASQRLLER